ncbi:MAG TPA: VOC family protein [Chloroflexota bacterium]|nr:VOC family protein [Chloroflexota bacterium]
MITGIRSATVPVRDQQQALDFYTSILGFEKRADAPMDGARWIEVAPPGAASVLILFTPPDWESRIGTGTGIVLTADDIDATYEELQSKGVTFTQPPEEQPWGGKLAQFEDMDGNGFVLVQNR